MLAGALFDWDGVIIDSHEAHERAWEALAAELGRPLPPGFSMDMTGLGPYFQGIAAEKDVVRGKPAPDVFLAAAEKIGVDPARCVVFEDAHVGIEAGRAAGAKTIAVATTHPAASFAGTADRVVETLEDVSLATLRELFVQP